ncbi:MAG: M6 family metalloprotease domain-containing protein [Candidatus Eisenbacteria bacterium]
MLSFGFHSFSRERVMRAARGPLAAAGIALAAGLVFVTLRTASAMPPPAPGNTRGLPASVREALRQDPTLFYPKKGFRPVIERQKAERERIVRGALKRGVTRDAAEREANQSVSTVRYCPVLCGIYADKPSPDWPVADLVDELFSLTYGATNSFGDPGSMREHYRDMSFGTFDLQGGVFGWFPVPQNGAFYYGTTNGLTTAAPSGQAGAYIRHTLEASDATVDFRPYDNDGPDGVANSGDDDGVADLVMFVHPNEGGECGGDDIWSHSFSYSGWAQHSGQKFTTNDLGANGQPIKVDDYVIMPALACGGGRRIEIGVFSHEFGHALGLPDLYDRTAYDPAGAVSTGGMGLYCLMAAGSYGGDFNHPETPTQMCAWAKEQLGFLTPHEVVCDESRELYAMDDAPEAVKLWRGGDYSQNEWFMVENRQRVKWDRYLLGTGLLVTHADNNTLTQNDESCPGGNPCLSGHYTVMVVEADNQWEMQAAAPPVLGPWFGEAGDFFSAENNDQLGDLTAPSSRDHQGTPTGVSVSNISGSARKMTADFSTGQVCLGAPNLAVVSSKVSGGCDLDPFVDPGEQVDLSVTIRNFQTAAPASGIQGTLTSLTPTQLTVIQSQATFPDLGRGKFGASLLPFRVQGAATSVCSTVATLRLDLTAAGGYVAQQTFNVQVRLDSVYVPFAPFFDNVESGGDNGWKHYSFVNEDDWSRNTNGNHTPAAVPGTSWFSAALPTGKDASLEPPAFIPSASSVVTYWHRYDTEDDWDGYVLELSSDGGATWTDAGDLTNIGYDDAVMTNPQSTISGRRSWNGLNAGFPQFEQVTLPLATWAGQTCLLRFRLACDLAANGVTPLAGVGIDDLEITDASILRERCEVTPLCGATETDPPVFAGLEEVINPGTPACDAVDLKWQAATDASPPVTYLIYASSNPTGLLAGPIASTTSLRHRVTGLGPGQTWRFAVRARDSQGTSESNAAEQSVTLDCDPPNLLIESVSLAEAGGCDGDGRPDAGEHLDVLVKLRNAGRSNATGVHATLTTLSNRVAVRQGEADYADLPLGHFENSTLPMRILIDSNTPCLTPATLQLKIIADGGYVVTRNLSLMLESDEAFQSEDFTDDVESGAGLFTHSAEAGFDDWGIVTTDAYSPTHSWFASDAGAVKNASLVSQPLYISPASVLTFRHRWVLESGFDGAVLEISTDEGATWTDIGQSYNSLQEPAGVAFEAQFAPGKEFWSGSSSGWQLETVNLGAMISPLGAPLYAGQVVLVRWRIGCDNDNTEPPHVGWWIDDIALNDTGTFALGCDAGAACQSVGIVAGGVRAGTNLGSGVPNPALASMRLDFQIAPEDAGDVTLRIFDLAGRLVRTLVDGRVPAGPHQTIWDRTNDHGVRVSGGVYFSQLKAGGRTLQRKVVMLK